MEYKTIHKYRSHNGTVADYVIHQVDHQGYLSLVKDSLRRVDTLLKLEDDDTQRTALLQLRESFIKSINGEHAKREINWDPNVEYLRGCVIDKIHIISKPEKKEVTRRSPITAAKAEYRKILPVSKYYGSFKLEEGKYESVTDGIDESISWDEYP